MQTDRPSRKSLRAGLKLRDQVSTPQCDSSPHDSKHAGVPSARPANRAQSLRKLSRVVEPSADTIFITDLQGVIESVNPAFENLTGQHHDEVCGRTSRISKSSERAPEVYHEIWETILAGNSYRGIRGESKKEWRVVFRGREHLPGSGRLATGHAVPFEGRDLTERLRLEAQLLPSQKRDAMGN